MNHVRQQASAVANNNKPLLDAIMVGLSKKKKTRREGVKSSVIKHYLQSIRLYYYSIVLLLHHQ